MFVYKNFNDKKRPEREKFSSKALRYMEIGVICLLLFISTACGGKTTQEAKEWVEVEITENLKNHLLSLPEDEQHEQMRDWVVLAFVNHLELDQKKAFGVLYDFTPIRRDFLEPLSNYRYGEGRSMWLGDGELYVFVPYNSAKKNVYIARISDEYRLVHGEIPEKANIVEYQIEIGETPSARFAQTQNIDKSILFSEEMGYYQANVSNKDELNAFLNRIDDIVYVQDVSWNLLCLGGRKFENHPTMGVNLEDVAAIYQADIETTGKQYIERLKEEFKKQYESFVQKKAIRNALDNLKDDIKLKKCKKIKTIEEEIRSSNPYEQYLKEKTNEYIKKPISHIGFSLDPILRYDKFSWNLSWLASGSEYRFHWWFEKRIKSHKIKKYVLAKSTEIEKGLENLKTVDKNGNIGELSLISLLNGRIPTNKENEHLVGQSMIDSLAKNYGFSIEELEKRLERDKKWMHFAINNNRDILKDIAGKISKKDTRPYLLLRRYLEEKEQIYLKTNQPISSQLDKMIFRDVIEMLNNCDFELTEGKNNYDDEVESAVKSFQEKHDLRVTGIINDETYLALKERPCNDHKRNELYYLNDFFFYFEKYNSYQKARYDGYFKGTEVGMTMFYTDLVMKLWKFDYEMSSPEVFIPGFRASVNYPMPYTYSEEEYKNRYGRNWLGPLESGYQFYDDLQLYFTHIATRLYSVSYDPLSPTSIEVEAVPSSARFSNWWNHHYSEVADYEQQYHRLNQIMKWSIIIKWLKEKGYFSFLSSVNVRRNVDFKNWYKSNKNLKVKVTIPFLDKSELGEITECLNLLWSRPYIQFAIEEKDRFSYNEYFGGVTLGPTDEIGRITKAPITQISPTSSDELLTKDGKKYRFDNNNSSVSIENISKTSKGKEAQYNLGIRRKVESRGRETIIIDSTGTSQIEKFKVSGRVNTEILSNDVGDFIKAEKLLKKINTNPPKIEKILNSTDDVKLALKTGKNKYLVKLKNSDNWFEINSSSKINPNFNISMSNGQTYQSGRFLKISAVDSTIDSYVGYKVSTKKAGSIPELTQSSPKDIKKTIHISEEGGYSTKAYITDDSIYIPNYDITTPNDLEILESLVDKSNGSSLDFLRKKLVNEHKVHACIYEKNGKILRISNQQSFNEADEQLFRRLLRDNKGKLKGMVFSEENNIRFVADEIVHVPYEMNQSKMKIFDFISSKTRENSDWVKTFRNTDNITLEDIEVLSKINKNNLKLGESYYPFKSVKNLPDDYALVDFNSSGSTPQLLVRTKNEGIRIINARKSFNRDVREIGEKLSQFYLGDKEFDFKKLVEETKSIANLQMDAIKSTNAKVIVIKGPISIDPAVISKIHKLPPTIRFVRDQQDVNKSVENAQMEITPSLKNAVFLSSVPLDNKNFKDITHAYINIISTGVDTISDLSKWDFKDILRDYNKTQLVLVIRAADDGLVFSDQTASFDEMAEILHSIGNKKEMLYIISNKADQLQQFFAESGKFSYVIGSSYSFEDSLSFKMALDNVLHFYTEFVSRKSILKSKNYKKIIEKYPELSKTLSEVINSKDRVGIFPQNRDISGFSRSTIKFKTIESIIDKIQLNNIRNMKKAVQKNLMNILKAIPKLKVYNIPKYNRRDNYDKFSHYDLKLA